MNDYKNVGTYPVELASGEVVPVGEFVALSAEALKDTHNQGHIEEGRLLLASKHEDAAEEDAPSAEDTKEKKGGR